MGNPYVILKKYEGQYVKYPQLCEITGDEKKVGKAKATHLKKVSQYVDFAQEKGRIYIHKVYDSDNEMGIIENHGKFTSYIKQFLINLFCQLRDTSDQDFVILTNRDILEMTYMVNGHYFIGKNAPYKYLDQFKLTVNNNDLPNEQYVFNKVLDEKDIFFSSSYRLLKRVIYDSLTALEKASLIQKNKTFRLYKNTKDKDGRFESIQHDCDESEISRVLSVQYKSVQEFNEQVDVNDKGKPKYFLKNIQSLHYLYPRQRKEFYDILHRNLEREFAEEGWNAYSTAWKINLANAESFNHAVQKISYKQLNQNVQDKLLNAKDLALIGNTLREQFVSTFIKV